MASATSYTDAIPSPSSSVATPLTTRDALCTAAPPHWLPDAPRMPICIGPAAPKSFEPLVTPGRLVRPSSLSTLPMPASTVHDTLYCRPTRWNHFR